MVPFLKKYKFVLLAAIVVIAALVIAFVSGGKLESQEITSAIPPTTFAAATDSPATTALAATSAAAKPSTAATAATQGSTAATQPATAANSTVVTVTETAATQPATRDNYQTESVPADKPQPVEPQEQTVSNVKHRCTVSVSCAAAWERRDEWSAEVNEVIPENGMIIKPVKVTILEGESVFDVLKRVCKSKSVPMEFTNTPVYNTAYIEGIGNLYEFDCGSGSGWMYRVNGWFPNYGCSRYAVQDGDVIEWLYTCNLGRDIGGENIQYSD